jgi:hypothetical protein
MSACLGVFDTTVSMLRPDELRLLGYAPLSISALTWTATERASALRS